MGKINILNDAGTNKLTLEFNGSSDTTLDANGLAEVSNLTAGVDYLAPNGDASQLTNLPAGYTDADVDAYIAANGHMPIVNVQRFHMGSGNSTTITSTSYTNVGNSISYTPQAAGNLIVVEHGVQTWNGSTSDGSGDTYIRFLVNGTEVWDNSRMTGNFDQDNKRQHLYVTSKFLFNATNTSAHTIQLQGYMSGSTSTGMNFYHTTSTCNQYIITEYQV